MAPKFSTLLFIASLSAALLLISLTSLTAGCAEPRAAIQTDQDPGEQPSADAGSSVDAADSGLELPDRSQVLADSAVQNQDASRGGLEAGQHSRDAASGRDTGSADAAQALGDAQLSTSDSAADRDSATSCSPDCADRCAGEDGCGGRCADHCQAPEICGGGADPERCDRPDLCAEITCVVAPAFCQDDTLILPSASCDPDTGLCLSDAAESPCGYGCDPQSDPPSCRISPLPDDLRDFVNDVLVPGDDAGNSEATGHVVFPMDAPATLRGTAGYSEDSRDVYLFLATRNTRVRYEILAREDISPYMFILEFDPSLKRCSRSAYLGNESLDDTSINISVDKGTKYCVFAEPKNVGDITDKPGPYTFRISAELPTRCVDARRAMVQSCEFTWTGDNLIGTVLEANGTNGGTGSVTCLSDGIWDHSALHCPLAATECQRGAFARLSDDGTQICTYIWEDTLVGEAIDFTVSPSGSGTASALCGADGTFSELSLVCGGASGS